MFVIVVYMYYVGELMSELWQDVLHFYVSQVQLAAEIQKVIVKANTWYCGVDGLLSFQQGNPYNLDGLQ